MNGLRFYVAKSKTVDLDLPLSTMPKLGMARWVIRCRYFRGILAATAGPGLN